jgi:hypothetical protein
LGRREDGIDNYRAGYDLLKELRRLEIITPFIFYAGWNAPGAAEAERLGASGSTNDPQVLLDLISRAVQDG